MSASTQKKFLESRIIKTANIKWKDLQFIQQDDFKAFPDSEKLKLKKSLTSHEFIEPFKVWENEGIIHCLDGKHRTIILRELIEEGVNIPDELPATFIDCTDVNEAAQFVLIFSSAYAHVTQAGIDSFIQYYDLKLPEVMAVISIPSIAAAEPLPLPAELEGIPKDKPATLKITFANASQLEMALPVIDNLLKSDYPGAFCSVSSGEI